MMRFDGSTSNVGIGCTPSAKLDIQLEAGAWSVGSAFSNQAVRISGGSGGLGLAYDDTTGATIAAIHHGNAYKVINFDGASYKFNINSSEKMSLDSTGLGIGGSASEQLTNYSASGNVTTLTQVGGSGNADLQLKNNSGDRTIRATADKLWFIDNTDTRTDMVIDGSGNLGIGTTSPSMLIDCQRSGNGNVAQFGDGTRAHRFYVDSANAILAIDGSVPYQIWTGGAERMRIDTSGNVGIGTTSPSSYKLQLGSAGDKIGVDLSSGGVTRSGEIEFYNSSDGSLNIKTNNASTGGINFHTQGTQRLTVARDGNVGISTTSPTKAIDARGEGRVWNGANGCELSYSTGNTSAIYASANTSGNIEFRTDIGATAKMFIANGGNVGIGTTAPQKALEISEAALSGGAIMRLTSTGETSAGDVIGEIEFYNGDTTDYTPGVMSSIKAIAGPSGGEGHLQFLTSMPSEGADASTVALHLHSNASVGIATSTPSANADLTLGNGELCMAETTTPTADANFGKIYCKSDNKLYFQDGAGTEHEIAFV